jgi:hypothetical protein
MTQEKPELDVFYTVLGWGNKPLLVVWCDIPPAHQGRDARAIKVTVDQPHLSASARKRDG